MEHGFKINKYDELPPKDLSLKLQSAIQNALVEEHKPKSVRYIKVIFATLLSTAALTVPIALVFRDQLGWMWQIACVAWAVCFLIGFSLHFVPQPRLSVPGYWSPSIFARILVIMTLLTGLQILLCPSFVFLESSFEWAPFLPITDWFMNLGGMGACMFSCGLIFSSMGALVTFFTIRKVLSTSAVRDLLMATLLAFLTQAPVIGVQIVDENLRPFALFWAMGSAVGLVSMAFLIRIITSSSAKTTRFFKS